MVTFFIVLLALLIIAQAAHRWGANSSDGVNSPSGNDASSGMDFTKRVVIKRIALEKLSRRKTSLRSEERQRKGKPDAT